ncbi:MAG: aspartyl protease family protein [Blastocatellia bacterium]|nr:aspartyl protease family protein [Blastocatellia bacterium]
MGIRQSLQAHKGVKFLLFPLLILTFTFATAVADAFENLYKKASKELREGNFSNAEQLYRNILDSNPEDENARVGLALVLLKQKNFALAYDEALKVLQTKPQNSRAEAIIGTALLRSGFFTLSVDHLNASLQINVKEPLALASAAEIDLYLNNPTEAFEKLKLATELDTDEPDYWILYARTASRLDLYRDAADALRSYLKNAPKTDKERRERIEGVIRFYNYLGNTNIYKVSGSAAATVPIKVKAKRPHFEAKINGKESIRFVLDTGAGVTVISSKAAERLKLKEVARGGNAYAVGGSGTFPIIYSVIEEIDIAGVKIRNVPVYIRQIHSFSNSAEDAPEGYLGLSVLSNFFTTIDYKMGQLSLRTTKEQKNRKSSEVGEAVPALFFAQEEQAQTLPTSVLPFRLTESGLISVEVKLDNESSSLNFILDSGASSSVISKSVVEKNNWDKKLLPNESVKIVGAAGITEDVKIMFANSLRVSDLVRENVRLPVINFAALNENSGFEQQGILGGDFLNSCRIEIDFTRLQVSVTPYCNGTIKKSLPISDKVSAEKMLNQELRSQIDK